MAKSLFNSLPNFSSTNINVDRKNDVLRNTCVANYGENKNGTFFDDIFLEDLVDQGNTDKGIKSRFGHPNMCSTSFGSYIGRYKNFSVKTVDNQRKVFADLHLDQITKKTQVEGKGITMYEYIMSMAESNPDMFGNSIHIFADTVEEEINGKVQLLHRSVKFKACDLVDDPAATDQLFSSSDDLGAIVTNFLDENPRVFESISKNPNIVEDFFERYSNYCERKSLNFFNMNFFERMKNKAKPKKEDDKFDIDITLADGSIIKVITDAEVPKVDDKVIDDTGAPVKDDEHLLPDGGSITTVGGVITEIKDKPQDAGSGGEPTLTEVMNSINELGKQFATFKKEQNVKQKLNEDAFELLQDNMLSFQKSTNLSLKNIKSTYSAPGLEGKTGESTKAYDADKVKEAREKIKNAKN